MRTWIVIAALAVSVFAFGQDKVAAQKAIDQQTQIVKELKDQAQKVTAKIGELAASGKLPTNDESVKLLQDLVQELAKINERLKTVQDDITGIKGWISGKDKTLPALEKDVSNLKKVKLTNYTQFQWSDTQEGPSSSGGSTNRVNSDGFNLRRIRVGAVYQVDPKSSVKVAFDLASGSQRNTAELRDAMFSHEIQPGSTARAGQYSMPLGYEIQRSSSEREFPERTLYNRTLFAGERNRGFSASHSVGAGTTVGAGIWNSLTISDPQLTVANSFRNLSGTDLGATAGLRHKGDDFEVGLTGFLAHRPRYQYTDFVSPLSNSTVTKFTPDGERAFLYLDWLYNGLGPKIALRGEVMTGRDRLPNVGTKSQTVLGSTASVSNFPSSTSFTSMFGGHIQASYKLGWRNQIHLRYERFDPDTGSSGNATDGYGLAFSHFLNAGAKLTLAHEIFREEGFDQRNNVTTIRIQYKL